ncbi:MAG TPA: right-handed parallel beta-helix repeat-containing protein [Bacteroidales bacterium]|nr:right-handed parallel beta-helix repeat-containing protein [Bacteroidales bacterium]
MKTIRMFLMSSVLFLLGGIGVKAQTNLQQILDNSENGDILFIENQVYESESTLILRDKQNVTLIFDQDAKIFCTSQYENVFNIYNCVDIKIINGTFKHKLLSEDKCTGYVFEINGSNDVSIINCDINGCGSWGVASRNSNTIKIINCYLHHNSNAAFYFTPDCKNVFLLGDSISDNPKYAKDDSGNLFIPKGVNIVDRDLTPEEFQFFNKLREIKKSPLSSAETNIDLKEFEGTYIIPPVTEESQNYPPAFNEGEITFKVTNGRLVGIAEQTILPMGGVMKTKIEVIKINTDGVGIFKSSWENFDRWGKPNQSGEGLDGSIRFINDQVQYMGHVCKKKNINNSF